MSRNHTMFFAATALLGGFLAIGAAAAQPSNPRDGAPQFNITGSGIGDSEMDHSRMGGIQGPSGAPEFLVTGGGLANAEMDHSRMGGSQHPAGGAPQFRITGSGIGDSEMDHSRMGGGQGAGGR